MDIGIKLYTATKRAVINQRTENNKGQLYCCQAVYQADSIMSGRIISGDTNILLTSDSDQAAILGPACICIKDFKFNGGNAKRKATISELVLFMATQNTLDNIITILNLPKDNNDNITLAKIPLFDGINGPRVRALIAVVVGCDVNLYPITFPSILKEFINERSIQNVTNEEDAYYELKKFVIAKFNRQQDKRTIAIRTTNYPVIYSDNPVDVQEFNKMLDIFVDTLMYEPTSADNTQNKNYTYIFGPPPYKLHDYIKSFDNTNNNNNNNNINSISSPTARLIGDAEEATDVVDCCMCVGTEGRKHLFLEAEGICCCVECGRVCCLSCICGKKGCSESKYCYDCYFSEVSVTTEKEEEKHTLSNPELRQHLHTLGVETTIADERDVLLDLYEAQNEQIAYDETTIFNKIKTPKHSANYLQILLDNNVLISTKFNVGGKFIVEPILNVYEISKLLKIMSSLVTMYQNTATDNTSTRSTYRNIPACIVKYAEAARIHNGFRLIRRAVRHATDPQTISLLNSGSSLHIVRYEHQLALMVHHRVRASMRDASYQVVVCFNDEHIIACSCECRAGCTGEGHVLCVHVLPVLYLITLQLYDGLADNIIIELANNWKRIATAGVSEQIYNEIKEHTLLLKCATHHIKQPQDEYSTLEELLDKYLVGTERMKCDRRTKKREPIQLMCPLKDLLLHSSYKIAENLLNNRTDLLDSDKNNKENQTTNNAKRLSKTTYQNIIQYITAFQRCILGSDISQIDEFVGYQLINIRAAPITFTSPGDLKRFKKDVVRLIEISNDNTVIRPNKRKRNDVTDVLTLQDGIMEQEDNVSLVDIKQEEIEETTMVVSRYKKRYTCCACKLTSTKDQTTTFHAVPFSHQSSLKITDDDNKRKHYYKRLYNRKNILRRFGINQSDTRTDLRYCGHHEWELVTMDYPWQKQNGKWSNETAQFKVPIDPTEPPSRTRQQQELRQPLAIIATPIKIKTSTNHYQQKKKGAYRVCSFWNCNNNNNNNTRFQRIPPIPKISERSKNRNSELMRYAIKYIYRINCVYCCGVEFDNQKEMRICNEHEIQEIEKEITWKDSNQQTRTVMTTMYLPKVITGNITPSQQRTNSGLGRERWINRQRDYVVQTLSQDVAQTVGFLPSSSSPDRKMKVKFEKRLSDVSINNKRTKGVFKLSDLTTAMVKDRTGFPNVLSMLSFIVVVCSGNIEKIQQTKSKLTWLEEWFLYLEVIWGKSATRWVDVERCYGLSIRSVRRVFDDKLIIHNNTVNCWPKFVDYAEDNQLKKQTWCENYGNRRIIMWDNTSLPMFKPSSSSIQRNTYSAYYAGNVAKGGVFIQPCGWIGTNELWVGSVSDTDYMEKSNAYQQQQTYLDEYDTIHRNIKWTIIFDKGYRVGTTSWSNEHHCEVIQPTFARSDAKFTDYDTLRSAAVAADRSANERAVCNAKRCGFLSNGLLPNECPKRFNDVWICWGFQTNFMYKPVL